MPPPIDPNAWKDRDEPLNVEMDPDEALRLLLGVNPDDDPSDDDN